jgi:hypothetical protein
MGPQTAAEKQQEITRQAALLAQATETGDPSVLVQAKQLKIAYHARDMAALADDVYDAADGKKAKDQPPAGYIRASANPEALRAAGIDWSNDQIQDRLHPKDSGFRAEIYLPDPAILGKDAKPVLVFKGTDSDKNEDWLNNARQGAGMQSDYYDRAMGLALALKTEFNNNEKMFEIAGHSLGGGLASAASAVTGAQATTFNSAGLHPETAPRFLEGRPQFNTDTTVNAYQVKGEVLTSVQNGLSNMTDFRRAQLGFLAQTASDLSQTPGLKEPVSKLIQSYVITPDKDASPEEKKTIQGRAQDLTQDAKELIDHLARTNGHALLKRVPTAAGEVMPMLEAKMLDKNGQFIDKPKALPLGELGELAGPIANALSITAAYAKAGQHAGAPIRAGGQLLGQGLDKTGDAQQAVLNTSAQASKYLITQSGEQTGQFVRISSSAAATGRQGLGVAEAGVHLLQGKAQGSFYDVSAGFFHKVGLNGLAERAQHYGQEARRENAQEATQALANANVDARQLRQGGDGVAKTIETQASATADYAQRRQAEFGRQANATTDQVGNSIRSVTAYAPAAGAVTGAALSTPHAHMALHNPVEVHKNQLAALFLMKSLEQATDRHLMTETVRPSLDFKIEQLENALRKHPLMQSETQKQADSKQHAALLHPLMQQALMGIDKLPADSFSTPQERHNAGTALGAKAATDGFTQIDRVVENTDRTKLLALQGMQNDPAHMRTHIEKADAITQPVAVSVAQLRDAPTQAFQPEPVNLHQALEPKKMLVG